MHLVLHAATVAAAAHAGQQRRGLSDPYINHPLRVAEHAVRADLDHDAVVAALLHDVVEDSDWTWDALAQEGFSPRTLDVARRLTKWWDDTATAEEVTQHKARYYAGILEDSDAVTLKLLDRADNIGDLLRGLDARRDEAEKYLRKTHREFTPILEACGNSYARRTFGEALTSLEAVFGSDSAAWC